ncbi:putative glycosyl hydrolase catalytic core [Lyophyllum shimeji]|uniref:Glycosyl hydrolase catalytic core n=1 Tax=Lyophyllum shimeji TaxID=47721 RepID=A0A9P3PPK8_LYOSH|nr:putative glycosyl hydrolase catalytic core [Lyophyllum shimeji]
MKTLKSRLTPNGIKAGIAGGDAYPYVKDHIGWWYDWSPNPSKPGKPIGVPMLWGDGHADATDAARLAAFKKISTPPPYVLAYEEPDCPPGSGSAGMSVSSGVAHWESLIAPLGDKGSVLVSPSMCKQADETWLAQFKAKISTEWDVTAIHINKNNLAGVRKDIEHYWNTYKKPIWVTEFACVNDKNGFVPCTDQDEINDYINAIVPYLQSHEHVYAFAYSNGLGLGNVWPLMHGGSLSESGKTYLTAISKYH